MSLATRCANCGTVFRVIENQLRASEGWVRCGRCEQVFNALETLFDLEHQSPPPWTPPGEADPLADNAPPRAAQLHAALFTPSAQVPLDALAGHAPAVRTGRSAWPPLQQSDSPHDDDDDASTRALDPPFPLDQQDEPPAFLRPAATAVAWSSPRWRMAFVAGSGVAAVLLVGQIALHSRDALAARWPAAQPVLQAACNALGCRIEPLRRLESLAVDSSGLTRVDPSANRYRLAVVLRNRDTVTLLLPSIDLTLTDTQGEVVSRRMLTPAELGATRSTLGPGAELALNGWLDAGDRRLAGYTVEIFYP